MMSPSRRLTAWTVILITLGGFMFGFGLVVHSLWSRHQELRDQETRHSGLVLRRLDATKLNGAPGRVEASLDRSSTLEAASYEEASAEVEKSICRIFSTAVVEVQACNTLARTEGVRESAIRIDMRGVADEAKLAPLIRSLESEEVGLIFDNFELSRAEASISGTESWQINASGFVPVRLREKS